jgi:FSR family fosmidomycin resistance protein-like MFS transporter
VHPTDSEGNRVIDLSPRVESSAPAAPVHRRWNLGGLSLIAFAHGLSDFYSGALPFVIFYVVAREHGSPFVQGALGFLWYLTSSVVQPLFGAYSDRRGRWWFIPAAIGLTIVGVSLSGAVHSIALLAACIVVGGLGSAVMHPEAGKYSAMLSGARKAGGISIFQIGGQIGYAIGPAVVAMVLARFGGEGTLLLAVPGIPLVAVLFATMPHLDRSAVRAHRARPAAATLAANVDRTGVTLLVASTGLRYFTSAAFMTYLPNLLVGRGIALTGAGQIVSTFLLVSSVGLLLGGYLADRYGAIRVSIASLLAAVPCLIGFFVLAGPASIAILLVASVLLAIQNAPGVALVQAMMPRNLGMALGLMNGVAFGVGSALVAVVGIAVGRVGAAPALLSVSFAPLAAVAGFVVVAWRRRS